MSKAVKEMVMADIRQRIGETRDLLVVDMSRLDGVTTNRFRLALGAKNISALSVRNTLAQRALGELGIGAGDLFSGGPSTLVWGGQDIVALSKEITRWVKELKPLEIKGGIVEGVSLTAPQVDALSKSPSREELLAQIAGLILSPGARLAAAVLGPGAALASQIKSIAEKESGESEIDVRETQST